MKEKLESLMCLGPVRSDSHCRRERKVKPKVAIIYLISAPSDGPSNVQEHPLLSLCTLRICLVFLPNTMLRNRFHSAQKVVISRVEQNEYGKVQLSRATVATLQRPDCPFHFQRQLLAKFQVRNPDNGHGVDLELVERRRRTKGNGRVAHAKEGSSNIQGFGINRVINVNETFAPAVI